MKKYIGVFSFDDYDNDGGQEPMNMKASNMAEAKKEAEEFIVANGQSCTGRRERSYKVDRFCIYEVTDELDIDIKAMDVALKQKLADQEKEKARKKEVDHMLKLMQKYPDEAKQIVVDNEVGS
jgi:hypothetical protein